MNLASPVDARVMAAVDPTNLAIRSSLRPLEHKSLPAGLIGGHFRTFFRTGSTTVLNAADPIVSLRWSSSEFRFVLQRLKAYASILTAFGTAQAIELDLVKLYNFTVANTGGTAVTLASGSMKGPGMAPSRVADLRASTTTALAGGTLTAEANPIGASIFPLANTLGLSASDVMFDQAAGHEHPLILDANQGFQVRIGVTQGATGVVRYGFLMDWAEVPVTTL